MITFSQGPGPSGLAGVADHIFNIISFKSRVNIGYTLFLPGIRYSQTEAIVIRIKFLQSYRKMCPGKSGLKYKVFFYRLDHFTAQ